MTPRISARGWSEGHFALHLELLAALGVAEAEPLYHEALKGRRELLGPRHPDTLSSAKWAAKLLNESGRAEEAARLRSEYGV